MEARWSFPDFFQKIINLQLTLVCFYVIFHTFHDFRFFKILTLFLGVEEILSSSTWIKIIPFLLALNYLLGRQEIILRLLHVLFIHVMSLMFLSSFNNCNIYDNLWFHSSPVLILYRKQQQYPHLGRRVMAVVCTSIHLGLKAWFRLLCRECQSCAQLYIRVWFETKDHSFLKSQTFKLRDLRTRNFAFKERNTFSRTLRPTTCFNRYSCLQKGIFWKNTK